MASADRSVNWKGAAENQRPTPKEDGRLHVGVIVGGGRGALVPLELQAVEAEGGGGSDR